MKYFIIDDETKVGEELCPSYIIPFACSLAASYSASRASLSSMRENDCLKHVEEAASRSRRRHHHHHNTNIRSRKGERVGER